MIGVELLPPLIWVLGKTGILPADNPDREIAVLFQEVGVSGRLAIFDGLDQDHLFDRVTIQLACASKANALLNLFRDRTPVGERRALRADGILPVMVPATPQTLNVSRIPGVVLPHRRLAEDAGIARQPSVDILNEHRADLGPIVACLLPMQPPPARLEES